MPNNQTVFSVDEMESISLLPKKTTVIMATCQSKMEVFMLSVLSFLIKSNPKNVEHFMVAINGGDERHGSTELQDKKQAFLEDIRKLKWHDRDMPITIQRVWSRIGHGEAIESCIPWVHTEYYTITHDDVLVQENWCEESVKEIQDENVIMSYHPPLILGGLKKNFHIDGWKLGFPHMNTALITCKKALISKLGVRWHGHHNKREFKIYEQVDSKEFLKYHTQFAHMESFPIIEEPYSYINMDIGAWVYNAIIQTDYKTKKIDFKVATHLGGQSWVIDKDRRIKEREYEWNNLEMLLEKYPSYKEIYEKHK